jgi:hypothetical protein
VISTSLQACGVVFPFAISTSIDVYLFMGITGLPPGEFSLTSPGTKIPGQVRAQLEGRSLEQMYRVMMMFYEWARLAANQAKGKITRVSWPETSL